MTKIQEISNKTGVSPLRIGKVKASLFGKDHEMTEDDWAKLLAQFEEKKQPEEGEDEFISEKVQVKVTWASQNFRNYVEVKTEDRAGKTFWMCIPYNMDGNAMVGKFMPAERITYNGGEYYRHGLLAGKKFHERNYKRYDRE